MIAELTAPRTGAWRQDAAPPECENAVRIGGRKVRPGAILLYLCHVGLGIPLTTLAKCLRKDRATLRFAIARIEDLRDDAGFDRMLCAAESGLRRLFADEGGEALQ